jgi:hypothetical protein
MKALIKHFFFFGILVSLLGFAVLYKRYNKGIRELKVLWDDTIEN